MAESPLPPKKDVANVLLEGPSVYVHLDPRREGVNVPKWFQSQPQLVLQIGLNMAVPIHDLDIADEGISCTLSFNRQPHWCFLPWSAIYALIGEDGRAMIWPDDVPPELAAQLERPKLSAVPAKKAKKRARPMAVVKKQAKKPKPEAPKPARRLASVPAPAPDEERADSGDDGGEERPEKRSLPPYLRIIK
jgi:stringent starvation protein B